MGKIAECPQCPQQGIPYQKDSRAHAHGRKPHIRMRTELNALESPISECKQNLRNPSTPSENPLDQPIKNPAVTHFGVQVPAPLCRVYLDPSSSLQINPLVCLHRCQLLGSFLDSQSWAQHCQVRAWLAQSVKNPTLNFGVMS